MIESFNDFVVDDEIECFKVEFKSKSVSAKQTENINVLITGATGKKAQAAKINSTKKK